MTIPFYHRYSWKPLYGRGLVSTKIQRTQVITPTPISSITQEWKTRRAFSDTNESCEDFLFFSHRHRKKSWSTAGCCFFVCRDHVCCCRCTAAVKAGIVPRMQRPYPCQKLSEAFACWRMVAHSDNTTARSLVFTGVLNVLNTRVVISLRTTFLHNFSPALLYGCCTDHLSAHYTFGSIVATGGLS